MSVMSLQPLWIPIAYGDPRKHMCEDVKLTWKVRLEPLALSFHVECPENGLDDVAWQQIVDRMKEIEEKFQEEMKGDPDEV